MLLWSKFPSCGRVLEQGTGTLPALSASADKKKNLSKWRIKFINVGYLIRFGKYRGNCLNRKLSQSCNQGEIGPKKQLWFGSGILRGHTMLITGGLANTLHPDKWRWRMCWVFSVSITSRKRKSSLKEMKLYLESSPGRKMSRPTT